MNRRFLVSFLAVIAGVFFAGCSNNPHSGGGGGATSANFTFYVTGFEVTNGGPNFYCIAGVVTLDSNGNILGGEQDYNDAFGFTSPQPSGDKITGGSLTQTAGTQQGILTLITNNAALGVNGTETFAIQVVNDNHGLIIQYDGSATSSGSFDLQSLSGAPSGNFAFTVSGVDPAYAPIVAGGIFNITGTNIQNGTLDANDNGTITTFQTFTGNISAPDTFGRGTLSNLSVNDGTGTGIGTVVNYYVVNPKVFRIIVMDDADAAVGSAYSQGTGTFSPAIGPSVFSVISSSFGDTLYAAAGMLATFTPAAAVPASARRPEGLGPINNFNGVIDVDEEGNVVNASPISGFITAASNGYALTRIEGGDSLDIVNLGTYMVDPTLNINDPNNTTSGLGGALLVELDPLVPGTGTLVPQTDTATASFTGPYAFGAQSFNVNAEVDFLGQGTFTSLTLGSASPGFLNDPAGAISSTLKSAVNFSGIANPDGANLGRYTMAESSQLVIAYNAMTVPFTTTIYQASGGYLAWVETDAESLFGGSLQKLTSATPAARPAAHLLRIVHH